MNEGTRVEVDLADEERGLLWRGLLEWGGPARCTEAMAVAMGFEGISGLLNQGQQIAEELRDGRALTRKDWRRALLATEVAFASNVVGSGLDWLTTTGLNDEETLRTLRSVQRKLLVSAS